MAQVGREFSRRGGRFTVIVADIGFVGSQRPLRWRINVFRTAKAARYRARHRRLVLHCMKHVDRIVPGAAADGSRVARHFVTAPFFDVARQVVDPEHADAQVPAHRLRTVPREIGNGHDEFIAADRGMRPVVNRRQAFAAEPGKGVGFIPTYASNWLVGLTGWVMSARPQRGTRLAGLVTNPLRPAPGARPRSEPGWTSSPCRP
jgi:hypothetical protein